MWLSATNRTVGQAARPPGPTALFLDGVTSSSVSLLWNAPNNPAGISYNLYRNGVKIALVPPVPSGPVPYTDSGLSSSTQYSYFVTEQNALNWEGPASNFVTPTTNAPGTQQVTWNAGFYGDGNTVISGSQDPVSRVAFEMNLVGATAGCLGYCAFMTWGAYETAQGVYATDKLDALYTYMTTHFATPKRLSIILEVGAFTTTHPGTTDGSTLPLYLQQNVGLYGQAGYRVSGVLTQPSGASGWWGGDGNGNTYCAQLHRTSVMNRFIALIQSVAAWAADKPFFEDIIIGENSLWVGANSANGGGSGYSDAAATTTQISFMQNVVPASPTKNIVYVNTYMQTITPAQNLETDIVNNGCTPGQTDTMGLTQINFRGNNLTSWGVAAYAGQQLSGSTATVTNWRDNGVHLITEVQAPDLGAFGGISAGSTANVSITFSAPVLTNATSASIVSPASWPNGTGYNVKFSNNTTRLCTVANNRTFTWSPGVSSDCTTAATVHEGGADGWSPQDLVDAINFAYKAAKCYVAVIPDSVTYVPIDRRWSNVSAVFLANPLINTSYPVNLP